MALERDPYGNGLHRGSGWAYEVVRKPDDAGERARLSEGSSFSTSTFSRNDVVPKYTLASRFEVVTKSVCLSLALAELSREWG